MAAKKSAASTAWKYIVGILVALMVLVLIAELGLRWFLSSQMTKEQEGAEVSFGSAPLTLGMLRGEIGAVDMEIPSTLAVDTKAKTITGQPATQVHLEGLSMGEDPVARELHTVTTLPQDFLLVTIQQQIAQQSGYDVLGDLVLTGLEALPDQDALEVEFGGGLFTLTVQPQARDGHMDFVATNSRLLAWDLPQQVSDAITEALSSGTQDQLQGTGLRVDTLQVVDGGLRLEASGNNVALTQVGNIGAEQAQLAG
ncbi:DUF2993 domain-containing protein [Corynebacterium lizhenjunii]|uniref:LmeA family phospholipid-binding protein n=1 Tax=Corynebacterium lizhenjunii TaxID=2709394 RepID=UPI0013EE39D0|nr:DUF2993 domain-containing protein [Corynebacterium lizhenjunii]